MRHPPPKSVQSSNLWQKIPGPPPPFCPPFVSFVPFVVRIPLFVPPWRLGVLAGGIITTVSPLLNLLVERGFRIEDSLLDAAKTLAGE